MSEALSAREREYRMQGLTTEEALSEGLVDLFDLAVNAKPLLSEEELEAQRRYEEEDERLYNMDTESESETEIIF